MFGRLRGMSFMKEKCCLSAYELMAQGAKLAAMIDWARVRSFPLRLRTLQQRRRRKFEWLIERFLGHIRRDRSKKSWQEGVLALSFRSPASVGLAIVELEPTYRICHFSVFVSC